jgi:Mrp family chromosome partitioning ATPase
VIPRRVLDTLRERWLPLVLLMAVAAVVAASLSGGARSTFQAEGQLLLSQETAEDQLGTGFLDRIDSDRFVANQIEVLESQPVVDAAESAGAAPGAVATLDVSQVADSDVVRVAATATSPEEATAAVEAVMTAYLELAASTAREDAEVRAAELERQLLTLSERIGDAGARAADPATTAVEQAVLQAQLEADTASYAELSAQRALLLTTAGLASAGPRVVEPADAAEPTARTSVVGAAVAGALAMGGLAVGGLLVRERVRNPVTGARQVEALDLDVRVLGELPESTGLDDGSPLPVQARDPDGAFGGAVRMLRRRVDLAWGLKPGTAVLVTSAGRGEGRTSVVANLGTACARAGVPTVVVDADLRRSGLGAVLGLHDDHGGLAAVAVGAVAPYEAAVPTAVDGLRAIGTGEPAAEPVELLATERATTAFHDAATDEVALVDGPPMQEGEGTELIAAVVDGVLVVVECGATTVRDLEVTVEALRAVTSVPIGVVLNRVAAVR